MEAEISELIMSEAMSFSTSASSPSPVVPWSVEAGAGAIGGSSSPDLFCPTYPSPHEI